MSRTLYVPARVAGQSLKFSLALLLFFAFAPDSGFAQSESAVTSGGGFSRADAIGLRRAKARNRNDSVSSALTSEGLALAHTLATGHADAESRGHGKSDAEVDTFAAAGAQFVGRTPSAWARAGAHADAKSRTHSDDAYAGSGSLASAYARGGRIPVATASSGSGTFAIAHGRRVFVSRGSDLTVTRSGSGPHSGVVVTSKQGAFTAINAGRYSATAFAGTFGNATARSNDVFAAAKTNAAAFATADQNSASSWAGASGSAFAKRHGGFAKASSSSFAHARVEVHLAEPVRNFANSNDLGVCTWRNRWHDGRLRPDCEDYRPMLP